MLTGHDSDSVRLIELTKGSIRIEPVELGPIDPMVEPVELVVGLVESTIGLIKPTVRPIESTIRPNEPTNSTFFF